MKTPQTLSEARKQIRALKKELKPLRQLNKDADEEMVKLARKSAHHFILNAKAELDRLANGYIGMQGGWEGIIKERDKLKSENTLLRRKLGIETV